MRARTDVHRPSAAEFDPENYDLIGVFDLHPEDGNRHYRSKVVDWLVERGHRFAGVHPTGQCDHCGAWFRYEAILLHRPTGHLITVGETCLGSRFETSGAQFKAARAEAARKAEATRELTRQREIAAEVAGWLAEQGDERLAELTYLGNGGAADANYFLEDVARKLHRYGALSPRQAEAVAQAVVRDAQRRGREEQREREEAVRKASATAAPSGRVEVQGTVGATWVRDNGFGYQAKARVVTDAGFVVVTTIPAALLADGDHETLRGRRVRFTVTLSPSEQDATVAFGSRPSKAALLN